MVEVYKRPRSPYWYYDLADPRSKSGRRRVSTRRASKSEALAVARSAEREVLDREQLGALEEITVEEALFRYVRSVVRKPIYRLARVYSASLLGYRVYKDDNLEDRVPHTNGRHTLPADLLIHRLTTGMVAGLREARAAEGLSEASINREVSTLRAACNLAEERGVRVSKTLKWGITREKGKLRWLTQDEAARFLAELDPDRVIVGTRKNMRGVRMGITPLVRQQMQDAYDLAVFLLDTGVRLGEASAIPWSSIDTLRWHWVDIYRTKTDNSELLTLTGRLREVLQRRHACRQSVYVFPGYGKSGAPRKSSAAIRRAMQRAELNTPEQVERYGWANAHTLRDTFASWLVQSGMSLFKVQKLLGHASPQMTMKYAKLEPRGVSDEAAAILDGLSQGGPAPRDNVVPLRGVVL